MGWPLEVTKMFLYISFPVGIFHYVNSPAYFEKWVIKAKEEYFPPESRKANEQMENFIRDFNSDIEKKRLDALESRSKQWRKYIVSTCDIGSESYYFFVKDIEMPLA